MEDFPLTAEQIGTYLPSVNVALVLFASLMTYITATTLSLEGKAFNLLKTLPISGRKVLTAKVFAAMLIMVLNRTYRNTKSILKWVFKNTGFRLEPYDNAAAGNSVKEKFYTDPAEQVDLLLTSHKELVIKNKLSPEDILVVSMRSQGSSALKDLKDERFVWNGVGNKRIVKDKANIVSAHRIKGLDATAVILVDVEEHKDPAKREDWKRRLLVGATRARKLLTVIRKK